MHCPHTGYEPSPKANGICARFQQIGDVLKGGNGRMWIVSVDINGRKRWVPHSATSPVRKAKSPVKKSSAHKAKSPTRKSSAHKAKSPTKKHVQSPCRYKGTEPSPKGFGMCAHLSKVGLKMKGTDGNV